jgi:predicted HTH domain antitoxin
MSSQTFSIELPDDILLALNESESDLKDRIRLVLAIHLFTKEKLTIGKAAQLCGMSRFAFEQELSRYQVPISNLTMEDVLGDIEKLQ